MYIDVNGFILEISRTYSYVSRRQIGPFRCALLKHTKCTYNIDDSKLKENLITNQRGLIFDPGMHQQRAIRRHAICELLEQFSCSYFVPIRCICIQSNTINRKFRYQENFSFVQRDDWNLLVLFVSLNGSRVIDQRLRKLARIYVMFRVMFRWFCSIDGNSIAVGIDFTTISPLPFNSTP